MKALILENYTTAYRLKEVEKPVAGRGQVLVKITASGVNPLDIKIKAGQAGHAQTRLPAILGVDMAGVVEAVGEPAGKVIGAAAGDRGRVGERDGAGVGEGGEGVSRFAPGDAVYGMTGGIAGIPGTLAEYAAVDADLLAMKPKNLSFREAAALPLIIITAWEGLVDRAGVGPGKTVLIHGGAGGVGHVAVQMARAKGASVFATVRPDKEALIKSYGATPIDYTRLSVAEYVDQYTGGEGFDIVMDNIGGATLDASFKAVKQYTGHVISILGWGTHSLAPLSFRGATYSGVFTLYPLISGKGRAHHGAILKEATGLIEAGFLKPLIDEQHYTFDTIAAAYQAIEQHTARGKVVVDID